MRSLLRSIVAVACIAASNAFAAEIGLLSAGALEPGLVGLIDSFQRETGHAVKAAFATAPAIRKRIAEGATVEEFKRSVLQAESLVYNQAPTGLYLDRLFERLGIAAQVRPKSTRYPDGAAALNHVIKGKGNEIGFGAVTEIIEYGKKGLKLVGPLPSETQNYTTYATTVVAQDAGATPAQAFVRYLTAPVAKKAFATAGIE